jgi:hypothetical protein
MTQLFAQAFLVPLLPADGEEPVLRYDEERALTVLPDGRPFIEASGVGETVTLTKMRSEADDYDQASDDARRQPELLVGTETRRVPAEQEDFERRSFLSSMTKTEVRAEPDDEDRDARGDEGFFNLATTTSTFVRAEAEDRDHDEESLRHGGSFDHQPATGIARGVETDDCWSTDQALAVVCPARLIP